MAGGSVAVRAAAVATLALAVGVLIDLNARGSGNPVGLTAPGADGPSAAVYGRDFPELELPGGLGHDGQQFYAVARDPWPPERAAPFLDRPLYRLQRPLYPWLAWLLHPMGGGVGLVFALFGVGLAATVAGCLALAALLRAEGRPEWLGALFAALPGTYVSLRISTADTLALALSLAAVVALGSRRAGWAAAAAAGAVLARESSLVLLVGVALARRDRRSWLTVAAGAGAGAAWALFLRTRVESDVRQVVELVPPFTGLADAASRWVDGHDLWAAGAVALAVGLGVVAVVRRSRWTIPALAQLAFVACLGLDVIGLDLNGTRTTMPLLAIGLLGALDREPGPVPTRSVP